jgi:hypothetical protein
MSTPQFWEASPGPLELRATVMACRQGVKVSAYEA